MNREVLFKAKSLDDGKWVEGYYAKLGYGKNVKHFIIQNVCLDEDNVYFYDIEIDLNTLCQYTGLNDNTHWEDLTESEKELFLSNWNYKENRRNKIEDWNGNKIWENDICLMVYNGVVNTYIIVWDKDELDFKETNGKENYGRNYEYLGCCEEIIAIGNIFDNADLLEVE